ncbi:MAG: hypothetical protein ACQETL_16335 [Bacteroidota bacterium]
MFNFTNLKFPRQDKIPYLIALFVGLLTWSINNIIENAKLSPLLEYEYRYEDANSGELRLTNLSSASRLANLTFNLCSTDTTQSGQNIFSKARIEAVEPAYLLQTKVAKNSIAGRCFDFTIDELQPNSKFIVHYDFTTSEGEILKLKNSGDQTVRIVESNLLTLAIRNQLSLNIFIFASSLVILFLYFFLLVKRPKNP